ncbi:hypothetical protein ABID96_003687 [Bacillus sp. OAE603]
MSFCSQEIQDDGIVSILIEFLFTAFRFILFYALL